MMVCLKLMAHLFIHTWFVYFILRYIMNNERFAFLRDHLNEIFGTEVRIQSSDFIGRISRLSEKITLTL